MSWSLRLGWVSQILAHFLNFFRLIVFSWTHQGLSCYIWGKKIDWMSQVSFSSFRFEIIMIETSRLSKDFLRDFSEFLADVVPKYDQILIVRIYRLSVPYFWAAGNWTHTRTWTHTGSGTVLWSSCFWCNTAPSNVFRAIVFHASLYYSTTKPGIPGNKPIFKVYVAKRWQVKQVWGLSSITRTAYKAKKLMISNIFQIFRTTPNIFQRYQL